jgi:hypothetical protein
MIVDDENDAQLTKLLLPTKRTDSSCCSFSKEKRSPYLASSIWFALSSLVYAITALQVCLKSGFTSENIQSLVASTLYVVAYLAYARAEWRPLRNDYGDGMQTLPATLQRF